MHIGERIKLLRKERKMTQEDLAKILKVAPTAVSAWESGRNKPLMDKLSMMSTCFDIPLSHLVDGTPIVKKDSSMEILNEKNVRLIGVYGNIPAGEPNFTNEYIEAYMPTLNSMLKNNKDYFFLRVKGNSMNKEFSDGSLILVEKTSYLEDGNIGVVLVNGHEATVKHVRIAAETITLIPCSTDPFYEEKTYHFKKDQVNILGKVVQAIKLYD
ncbi:LexA family protein [Bacillus sp. mrc49]|uniref:LexA family protein n=1 Tax=Bacillus sp. mrc49 TaxID=2054913 RepID=UPI000C277A64|nr:XRE family transcriptional regulator [Bacillus sp. mrc49]PJN89008.1 LexA family transcriptional regulator [Bacillus sp. mrc49]